MKFPWLAVGLAAAVAGGLYWLTKDDAEPALVPNAAGPEEPDAEEDEDDDDG